MTRIRVEPIMPRSSLSAIADRLAPAVEKGMNKALLYLLGQVPPYPAPSPTSTYRRTGQLGRSITTRVEPGDDSIVGFIGTNIEYAQYVIDKDEQAWMHKGRWWNLQDVVENNLDKVTEYINEAIREAIEA
jgi:hypothetical protein